MMRTDVLEVGTRARAALAAAASVEVLMTFSRGEVLRTDRGEIVWVDCDADAFSTCGVTTMQRESRAAGVAAGASPAERVTGSVDSALHSFMRAIRNGASARDAAPLILGLGPGLTPSGDDFLGGFLATAHHLGRAESIETNGTHEISRARLDMHMRGEGTRAELRFVRALLRGDDTRDAERALAKLGHTSGHDFMRGARFAAGADA